MDADNHKILKFVPPKSFVHPDFWFKLADIKLHIDKLCESQRDIHAFISNSEQSRLLVEIDCTAFNNEPTFSTSSIQCHGTLLNKNTIEDFKNADKTQLIKNMSNKQYERILSKERLDYSSDLARFVLLSFADFKTHNYYYWFGFPALRDCTYTYSKVAAPLSSIMDEQCSINFEKELQTFKLKFFEPFFVYSATSRAISKLSDLITHQNKKSNMQGTDLASTYFCCDDHSTDENPSWLLRQFLGYLVITCPKLLGQTVKCVCIRGNIKSSIVHWVVIPCSEINLEQSAWIGWEANDSGKFVPRLADMSRVMDPMILAEKSISLNLTLMKWRLLPNLDLDVISKTKYLLLGAGTLGCGVARSLLAWGAQHITFIDYGKVSLSNPVRQSLFLYEDAINGGRPKATTAAERLKQINPCIASSGHCFKIPMPGHSVGQSQLEETNESLNKLNDMIKSHDVVFLLTDSRESRWLPTMLATYNGKMAINTALGFDSFLIMRHGAKSSMSVQPNVVNGFKELPGSRLGCYFCNDVVAPGNSLKDRTLDQQCTVTRPAVANIASSLAVELTISLLQHKYRDSAPAYYRSSNTVEDDTDIPEDILGIVPHSIRGNISVFNYLITATEKFSECIACSKPILEKFEREGNDFIINVLNSSKILEDAAGISELTCSVDEAIDFESDSD